MYNLNLGIIFDYKSIPTYLKEFDDLIGGGLPLGRITELAGEPDIGKTKLIFDIIESITNNDEDMTICYIATSNKTLAYIKSRGFDELNNLIIATTNKEDEVINIVKKFSNIVDLIIIDSMAEVLTNNEKGTININDFQGIPRILCTLNTEIYNKNCALFVINYVTYKDGVIASKWRNMYKKYCSLRLLMDEEENIKIISHKLRPDLIV